MLIRLSRARRKRLQRKERSKTKSKRKRQKPKSQPNPPPNKTIFSAKIVPHLPQNQNPNLSSPKRRNPPPSQWSSLTSRSTKCKQTCLPYSKESRSKSSWTVWYGTMSQRSCPLPLVWTSFSAVVLLRTLKSVSMTFMKRSSHGTISSNLPILSVSKNCDLWTSMYLV